MEPLLGVPRLFAMMPAMDFFDAIIAKTSAVIASFFIFLATLTSPALTYTPLPEALSETSAVPKEVNGEPEVIPEKTIEEKVAIEKSVVPTQPAVPVTQKVEPVDEGLVALKYIPQESLLPIAGVNRSVREALVNIFCTTERGGSFKPISASGIMIDPRGVILTNAHTAQYLLLRDHLPSVGLSCVVRTGSPAKNAYTVELLYIPEDWVKENKYALKEEIATGTGEDDYALLYISGTTNGNPLPPVFPFMPVAGEVDIDPIAGYAYLLAGYPAGFISGILVQRDLFAASAPAEIKEMATFGTNTVDILYFGGTVVAQRGSSGGPAVSTEDGKVIGIIATLADAAETKDRNLAVVTLSHINRSLREAQGVSLQEFLVPDLSTRIRDTKRTAPTLAQELINALTE